MPAGDTTLNLKTRPAVKLPSSSGQPLQVDMHQCSSTNAMGLSGGRRPVGPKARGDWRAWTWRTGNPPRGHDSSVLCHCNGQPENHEPFFRDPEGHEKMVRGSLSAFFRIFFSFAKRGCVTPSRSKVSEQIGTPLISKLAVNSQLYLSPCSSLRHCQNYTPFRFQSSYTRPPYPAAIPHLLHHFIICAHSRCLRPFRVATPHITSLPARILVACANSPHSPQAQA